MNNLGLWIFLSVLVFCIFITIWVYSFFSELKKMLEEEEKNDKID